MLAVVRLTNAERRFYTVIGPFLAKREVHKAIGSPPWDDDGKQWFAALDGNMVVGFAAAVVEGGKAVFCSDWIRAGDPHEKAARGLLMVERLAWAKSEAAIETAVATVGVADREAYTKAGFKATRETKNYSMMTKEFK